MGNVQRNLLNLVENLIQYLNIDVTGKNSLVTREFLLMITSMARSSTSYSPRWTTRKTKVIRVPEDLADCLLELAKKWDSHEGSVVREGDCAWVLEFGKPRKSVTYNIEKPINVSSVPQRSPFRYPGGKTWLVPRVRQWLQSRETRPARLIEPFAGGGIVSLTAGFERLAGHVVFAEKDEGVAAVWKVVLNGKAQWLADRIRSFELNHESVSEILLAPVGDVADEAFRTIIRNRVQRGGIMAKGAGLVKTGENGRGLNSRWYPETLARRILEINQIRERFTFGGNDGISLIREHLDDEDAVFYVDPPYTIAGKRLYTHWDVDHETLFSLLSKAKGSVLMSYDNTPEVVGWASKFKFKTKSIAMKSTHHAKLTELLISRNLSWLQ
jgi:DNA adenine methylase